MRIFYAVYAVSAVFLAGMVCLPSIHAASSAAATIDVQISNPKEIQVTATDFSFTPSEITVAPNDKVKLTLVNKGKKAHNIRITMHKTKVQLPKDLQPGESGTLQFTAPSGPGTYTFDCPVDFHAEMGMKGKLAVR